jgi:hypothetical protein
MIAPATSSRGDLQPDLLREPSANQVRRRPRIEEKERGVVVHRAADEGQACRLATGLEDDGSAPERHDRIARG